MEREILLDGRPVRASDGETLATVLRREGVKLPTICLHEQLSPIGTCDLCLVEKDGKLVHACGVKVGESKSIMSSTPRILAARYEAASRILENHELYCTICDNNNGNCTLHNTLRDLELESPRYPFREKPYETDRSHPFYRYDPSQCILCGRCVQACQELQVNETLSIDWSLPVPRVVWDGGSKAGESSCVSCGHCVSVCPCNALMEKSMEATAGLATALPEAAKGHLIQMVKAVEPVTGLSPIFAISEVEERLRTPSIAKTKTVCTYCGVGCSFDVWTRGRRVLKVEPENGPVNGISTCVKGKFGWEFVNSRERLTDPLVRDGDHFRSASWEEAFSIAAGRIGALVKEHGPDSVGFIASSKCTNEEAFLMQKLARAVVGTNNVDNCSRYCQSPATMGLSRTVGYGGDSGSIRDIEAAGLVLIVGSNTAESHPVIATRIKRSHKSRGQRLIVADLRRHEMAERADIFLRPRPGSDLIWLSAITKHIIDSGLAATDFLANRVEGLDAYLASLAPFTLDFAAQRCGVDQEALLAVAHEIATASSVCILWAMGVTQHEGGSDTSTAISNLLLVTGNYGKPGAGAYPLRGHNNVQGATDFGAVPNFMPGYEPIAADEVRAKYEAAWGTPLPTTVGLDNHEMVDAIHDGKLKGLLIVGEEMGVVDSNSKRVTDALRKLELLVVQDIFFSRTAQFADVILAASPSLEKEGTFTNTERRIQRFDPVLPPLGNSLPDWKITAGLAASLGAKWAYSSPSEVMTEAASLAGIFAGVSYGRLEGYHSQQWPVAADGVDTPLLFIERFNFPSGKARLVPLEFVEPAESPNEEYDLHLNNGRLLEHFHEGNMTYRVSGIADTSPGPFVEISPELAAERGLASGALVRLVSRRGGVKVRAIVTDRVRGNELYLPMNSSDSETAVNTLTSWRSDRSTHTPAFKELAVRMEIISTSGPLPLPKSNFRFGKRTPQRGVKIQEKWARKDYRSLTD